VRPDQKRHLYDAIQGMVDALVTLPEITDAFERWDAQLGVSARARRLLRATEQSARRRHPTRAQRDAQRDATEAFTAATAGHDLWDSGLLVKAAALLRDLGYRASVDLSFHLVTRFVQVNAASGGWPLPDAPDPDFSPGWGYDVKLQAAVSPENTLRRLKELEVIARAAQKAQARRGRRAESDAEKWRRAGRWYFLHQTGRPTDDLVRMRHRERGAGHAKATWSEGVGTCESCERTVPRDLADVRKLVEEWRLGAAAPPGTSPG
jgi:hypothetical protein